MRTVVIDAELQTCLKTIFFAYNLPVEEYLFPHWWMVLNNIPKLFLEMFQYKVVTLVGSLNSKDRSYPC